MPESDEMTGVLPLAFEKWITRAEVPFHNRITGNFMVYQDRLETIYCSYSRTQKIQNVFLCFFYFFLGQHVAAQKQVQLVTIFVFLEVSIALNSFTAPLTYRCSGVPEQHHKIAPYEPSHKLPAFQRNLLNFVIAFHQ